MDTNDKNEEEYLKDLAPGLFSKDLEKDRSVPEGYFDSIEEKVLAKVETNAPESRVFKLINYRNLAIAAGVAILLAFLPTLRTLLMNETVEIAEEVVDWDSISDDAATLYLSGEFDEEELYSELDWSNTETFTEEDLSEEAIIDYLMEENLDEQLLYESF